MASARWSDACWSRSAPVAFTQPDQFLTELLTQVRPLASAPSPSSTRKAGQ
jgi:hypothetical protein